jgi:hypothetical protein
MRVRMWKIYGGLMVSEIEDRVPKDIAPAFIKGLRSLVPDVTWTPE